jgi:hypothetical protein
VLSLRKKHTENFTFTFAKILLGYPEGKRPLARRRLRWNDNNKMDLK